MGVAEGEISTGSFADCSSSLGRDVRDMGSGSFENTVGEDGEALTSWLSDVNGVALNAAVIDVMIEESGVPDWLGRT